ncbi:hypothetical protein [Vibrio qingdaonensis]|uniref:hypothetical protein n=1 Tax=Vibrio qingdaonensis TaxID=2829491 RepID=UPI002435D27F
MHTQTDHKINIVNQQLNNKANHNAATSTLISCKPSICRKPNLAEATKTLITQVKAELPLYDESTFKCGPDNSCIGCPKKLLELVETEVSYWESALDRGITPNFEELRRFGKLCHSVRRGLMRNGLVKNNN